MVDATKYALKDAESEKVDKGELRKIGREYASKILLNEYLARHGVPQDIRGMVYLHIGNLSQKDRKHSSSYKAISQIEQDYLLKDNVRRGELTGLVDVALGYTLPQEGYSSETQKILEREAEGMDSLLL